MVQNKNEAVEEAKLNKGKLIAKIICVLLSLIAVALLVGLVYHMVTTISVANNIKILQEIGLGVAYLIGFGSPLVYLSIAGEQVGYQEWVSLTIRFVVGYFFSILFVLMICACIPSFFNAIPIK